MTYNCMLLMKFGSQWYRTFLLWLYKIKQHWLVKMASPFKKTQVIDLCMSYLIVLDQHAQAHQIIQCPNATVPEIDCRYAFDNYNVINNNKDNAPLACTDDVTFWKVHWRDFCRSRLVVFGQKVYTEICYKYSSNEYLNANLCMNRLTRLLTVPRCTSTSNRLT